MCHTNIRGIASLAIDSTFLLVVFWRGGEDVMTEAVKVSKCLEGSLGYSWGSVRIGDRWILSPLSIVVLGWIRSLEDYFVSAIDCHGILRFFRQEQGCLFGGSDRLELMRILLGYRVRTRRTTV